MEHFPTQGALRISASAGSGKTFTLTNLYIKKALQYPNAFKGMIAITFTNKAASELRERIIERLIQLATKEIRNEDLDFLEFQSGEILKKRANEVLQKILHDFDDFKVTTIDSFFQSLFSKLAFEANLPHGLKTELDLEIVKKEVIEIGLKELPEKMKTILLENIVQILSNKGKGWRTANYLEKNLMESLFSEPVVNFNYSASVELLSDEEIKKSKKILETYCEQIKENIKAATKVLLNTCEQRRFSKQYLNESDKTFIQELEKVESFLTEQNPNKTPNKSHFEGEWYRKPKSKKLSDEDVEWFKPYIFDFAQANSPKNLANLMLAEELLKHLSAIRLLVYFRQILKEENQRQNRFLLVETKYLLKSIIGDSDVPYIYERLGSQVHTLLIDEFQDTDQVQWKVIEPLAKAILDKNGFFSVVGDVKQSIYGWRGADSTLFKKGINNDLLPYKVTEKSLSYNFRSEGRIVDFNNFIFSNMASIFPDELRLSENVLGSADWVDTFLLNYEDVKQNLSADKSKNGGFVDLKVSLRKKADSFSENEFQDNSLSENEDGAGIFNWIIQEIKDLQDSGIESSEIAILVRGNSDLSEIIRLLDKARIEKGQKYDFRFSATGSERNGDQLLFDFLATALANLYLKDDFHFHKMMEMAKYLEMDKKFWSMDSGEIPNWVMRWKKSDFYFGNANGDLQSTLRNILFFFDLHIKFEHQQAIIQFQNYVFQFEQQQYYHYSDFLDWWTNKVSELKLNQTTIESGIQVMTIHKSKGLDFGVVILAINSTSTGDSLLKFDFWPNTKFEPWNAYALQKAKAKKNFLESDLGNDFQEYIYKQALENLNLWYVACTRPRYGLVINITLDTKIDSPNSKSVGKLSRLAYQIPRFLAENSELVKTNFPESEITQDEDDMLFRFQYGDLSSPTQKKKDERSEMEIAPDFSIQKHVMWLNPTKMDEENWFGVTFHKILEKTSFVQNWEKELEKMCLDQQLSKPQKEKLRQRLDSFFKEESINMWFSEAYSSYPELEFVNENGEILRADRVLMKNNNLLVLDFKTGDESPVHLEQLRAYSNLLKEFSAKEVEAFLVYTKEETKILKLSSF